MVQGGEESRYTPALLFCFNREECWNVAELLKGKKCVSPEQQKQLADRLSEYDWSEGAGPKLKQILIRGIGVHHAGVLPRYRRVVEELFQEKLLSVCVCTETLAAGINLPARSVVLPTLLKGPRGKMKVIEPSSAKQMFGRAGRPQFDDQGYVFALPHEDDVKILRWKEKYDQIPDDTKDPGLRKAKKALKKKQPKRRDGQQYWTQEQFEKLVASPSADLSSRGPLPWRLLVYMLDVSPDVDLIRKLVAGRLLDSKLQIQAQNKLNQQLMVLWRGGYVTLDPKPPLTDSDTDQPDEKADIPVKETSAPALTLDLGQRKSEQQTVKQFALEKLAEKSKDDQPEKPAYKPVFAEPTEKMVDLLKLRGVHPLYALFLMNHLGIADKNERIMAFESILELSRSLGRAVRIPKPDKLPPGPLATTRLDSQLLTLGLATAEELGTANEEEDEQQHGWYDEDEYVPILTLPYKLLRLFEYDFPGVDDVRITPVWVAGEVMQFGTDFNKYITSHKLQKQEGIIFRHLLRMILLLDEMVQLCPPDVEHSVWKEDLVEIANQLEEICRHVDPRSTDQWLAESR